MGKFLTSPADIRQTDKKGIYEVTENELYKDDDGSIYLVWRGFRTDNFTWINSSDWDIRCSHGHDVGCKYHQVVKVLLNEQQLRKLRLLYVKGNRILCSDLHPKMLQVKTVSGHWINNFFYRMLKSADCPKTPKHIQLLYRTGVSFNLGWFWSGKEKIDLKKIYDSEWNKGKSKK